MSWKYNIGWCKKKNKYVGRAAIKKWENVNEVQEESRIGADKNRRFFNLERCYFESFCFYIQIFLSFSEQWLLFFGCE